MNQSLAAVVSASALNQIKMSGERIWFFLRRKKTWYGFSNWSKLLELLSTPPCFVIRMSPNVKYFQYICHGCNIQDTKFRHTYWKHHLKTFIWNSKYYHWFETMWKNVNQTLFWKQHFTFNAFQKNISASSRVGFKISLQCQVHLNTYLEEWSYLTVWNWKLYTFYVQQLNIPCFVFQGMTRDLANLGKNIDLCF